MNTETAYNQALDYLYSFVDYSLKKATELAKAEFNLDRMFALLDRLGNPHHAFPAIHVAGTKGKGSTCAFAAAALDAAGYRTGLYTSPHLHDFCERIQVDGQPISHTALVALVEEIKPAVAAVPRLTTFEISTALGFLYFARAQVDAAVIEVGLGGRLDATNVLMPRVAVITALSYDHMAVLGNTLAQIAGEKAGIIKPETPVVSAPQTEEALEVITRIARERSAPLTLVGRDVLFATGIHDLDGQAVQIRTPGRPPLYLQIPLLGAHQAENAAVAYAALVAGGFDATDENIARGFAQANWPGRFEVVCREPPVVLDSAHNDESARRLRQALDDYFPGRPVTLIFGASEDKNVAGMLAALKPRLSRILAVRADHPRALDVEALLGYAGQAGVESEAAASAGEALERAIALAGRDGLVLSAGSIFITAEVRQAWKSSGREAASSPPGNA
jgi:dihydrofolate synthase/folylpolyglutamate synthase